MVALISYNNYPSRSKAMIVECESNESTEEKKSHNSIWNIFSLMSPKHKEQPQQKQQQLHPSSLEPPSPLIDETERLWLLSLYTDSPSVELQNKQVEYGDDSLTQSLLLSLPLEVRIIIFYHLRCPRFIFVDLLHQSREFTYLTES